MNFDWKVCNNDTTKRTVLQELLPQEYSRIPVQTTAVSQRKYPQGGRAVGMSGRRVQDGAKRMRLEVTDDDDFLVHTLPRQKPQPPKQPHDLAVAKH